MGYRVESQQQRTQYWRDAVSRSADYIKISQRGFGGTVTNRLHIIVNQGTTSHNIDVCLRETTFMIVRLGLCLRWAVALLQGVGRGSIGGIERMSMLLLLDVLLFRMNDRDRRRAVVLGGWSWGRAMVGEGGYSWPSGPHDRGYMPSPP